MTLTYKDASGATQTVTVTTKSVVAKNDSTTGDLYNEQLHPGDDEVYFVPETGEVVFGDKIYDKIRAGSDLQVTYKKTEFDKNDIRPEHYFNCTAKDNGTGTSINYTSAGNQSINYQINFSQTLTVNTEGVSAISMSVGRKIEEIINVCNDYDVMEANLASVEKRISDCDENDTDTLKDLNELKDQITTQIALQKTVLEDALASGITTCQNSQDQLNVALADHGARYNRMLMTKEGLETQEIDTEEAKSDNEDADLGEAYINFNEANLLYQATLGATSKILGQSLLVKTKYFGEVDLPEEKIVTFDRGIIGFPDMKKYTILYDCEKEETNISWLQSVDEPTFAMPIIKPWIVKEDYNPVVEDELLQGLGELTDENLVILLTMNVPSDLKQMSVNLKAPFIINSDTRKGAQIIVENQDYEIKYRVYDILKNKKEA
jgi:flagellar assembly factor FliW/flagellin-like hook-associated protein FlgL